MKQCFFAIAVLGVNLLLLSGCRAVGPSGFEELTADEEEKLAAYAAGVLLKTDTRVLRRGKPTPIGLQSRAARNHVRTTPPVIRIDYQDDLTGLATFTWTYDYWQYRVYCQGKLNGSFDNLQWCLAVAPPAKTEEGKGEIWHGPDPDMLELEILYNEGWQLLPDPDGKLEYEFQDETLRNELKVEGAVIRSAQ